MSSNNAPFFSVYPFNWVSLLNFLCRTSNVVLSSLKYKDNEKKGWVIMHHVAQLFNNFEHFFPQFIIFKRFALGKLYFL